MSESEIDLWPKIVAGDQKAWKLIVRRFQPLVYAVATRAGLSMADAADCFQQTFISLYQHRNQIQDPTRLSAWLATTAKREAFRLKRSQRLTGDIDDHPDLADGGLLPDQELELIERQSQLEAALKKLQERCRTLLTALFFSSKDVTYMEIAASAGIAVNSLGPIRQRCLERLKQILEENSFPNVRNDM